MKQPGTITLHMPEPCDQDWEQMQPVACGRFCDQCGKNLIDFTVLADEQIAALLNRPDGRRVCGRFSEAQLNRPIALPAAPRQATSHYSRRLAAALLLIAPSISYTPLYAQQSQEGKTFDTNHERKPEPQLWITITGSITDAATGDPLEGMELWIDGADVQYSNAAGNYTFSLPASFSGKTIQISARYHAGCAPEKQNTAILAETLTLAPGVYNHTVNLNRYPALDLRQTEIKGRPERQYSGIIAPSYSTPPRKPGLWKRIKATFKHKPNS